jgi:hypothetical protein
MEGHVGTTWRDIMSDESTTPHDMAEIPKRKSFTYGIVSGGGTPSVIAERMAKEAKPEFLAFIKTLSLSPEQETQVLKVGEAADGDRNDSHAGVKAVTAMRETLLTLRPDLTPLRVVNEPGYVLSP